MNNEKNIVADICKKIDPDTTIYKLTNNKGELGGYKIVNNSQDVDVAYTEWLDNDGISLAYISPTSKPSQIALQLAESLDQTFTSIEKIDCATIK